MICLHPHFYIYFFQLKYFLSQSLIKQKSSRGHTSYSSVVENETSSFFPLQSLSEFNKFGIISHLSPQTLLLSVFENYSNQIVIAERIMSTYHQRNYFIQQTFSGTRIGPGDKSKHSPCPPGVFSLAYHALIRLLL